MDTKILIGGGVAAVFVGFVVIRKMSAGNQEQQSEPQVLPDTGYFSGLAPTSGGTSSGGGGYDYAPSDSSNSGSSDLGGGFDISSLMGMMFKSQAETAQMGIRYDAQNFDSSIVGQVIGVNGTATITHTANGTTITNSDGGSPFDGVINSIYKNELGRTADEAGATYWKNQLLNNYQSIGAISDNIRTSDEYKKLRGIVDAPKSNSTYSSTSTNNADGTVTVTEKATR